MDKVKDYIETNYPNCRYKIIDKLIYIYTEKDTEILSLDTLKYFLDI